ncbi:MAG: nucleoside deaminase [Gemmataceae bacterium]|nr:nucleoside deaminase [Gemmataceae bacterium]
MLSFDDLLRDPAHPFHHLHMETALEEARLAYAEGEVPIGAVVVHPAHGVIARAHNLRETLQDPTAHAEMLALTQAAAFLESWRLEGCALWATLEPCPMCAGALVQARVPLVFWGCDDPKAGACRTLYRITDDPRLNHRCAVLGGIRAEECAGLLRQFFLERRAEGKK